MKSSLRHIRRCNSAAEIRKALNLKSPEKYKIHKLLEKEQADRRVTLEFKTKAERDEWMKWYVRDGSNNFWGWLATFGPRWWKTKIGLKWRKVAEDRLNNWPHDNERFV